MRYAAGTDVSSDRSKQEIERTLQRYGADQFLYGWTAEGAIVGFRMHGRMIRFILPMPDKKDQKYATTPTGRARRNASAVSEAWEQDCRQRWRALALVIKAKLEAVESGICTFEHEFLANIVLPDNSTVGQWAGDQINQAYSTGKMPALLPAPVKR